jgi:hypothetical protein
VLQRGQIKYLSYITTESNLASIIEYGILCHNQAAGIDHESIAEPTVQQLRAQKQCGGRALHDYANLYFWPRNAMMYRVRADDTVCVVKVSCEVLDLPGVHYSSRNAAVGDATFHAVNGAEFAPLEYTRIYAGSWVNYGVSDDDLRETMQAEVLVPGAVRPGVSSGGIRSIRATAATNSVERLRT